MDPIDSDKKIAKRCFELISNTIYCHICKMVPRGSVFQKVPLETGIVLCEMCLKTVSSKEEYQRNIVLENTLAALEVTRCKFRRNGCQEIDELGSIVQHEQSCHFRRENDPNDYSFDHDIKPESKPKINVIENNITQDASIVQETKITAQRILTGSHSDSETYDQLKPKKTRKSRTLPFLDLEISPIIQIDKRKVREEEVHIPKSIVIENDTGQDSPIVVITSSDDSDTEEYERFLDDIPKKTSTPKKRKKDSKMATFINLSDEDDFPNDASKSAFYKFISTNSTGGYFNIGDVMWYIAIYNIERGKSSIRKLKPEHIDPEPDCKIPGYRLEVDILVAVENTRHPSNAVGYITKSTSIGTCRPKIIRSNFLYRMSFDDKENSNIIDDLRNYDCLNSNILYLKLKYQKISRILGIEDKNERMKYFLGMNVTKCTLYVSTNTLYES